MSTFLAVVKFFAFDLLGRGGRRPRRCASDCPAPFAPSCWAFHERQISPWGSHPFKYGGKVRKSLANISACQARGGRNRTRTCDPIDVNDVLYQLSHATLLNFEIIFCSKWPISGRWQLVNLDSVLYQLSHATMSWRQNSLYHNSLNLSTAWRRKFLFCVTKIFILW